MMKSTIRGMALGTTAAMLLGLCGCGENNEARVDSGGVTPPNAATTSDEGLKAPKPDMTKSPYMTGPSKAPPPKVKPASK
jgi:hypothetical protein